MAETFGGLWTMKAKLRVPGSIAAPLRDFLEAQGIAVEVVTDEPCAVEIVECPSGERLQSDTRTIYSGGWIACETARDVAGKLGVPLGKMGKLMDQLNVKIRQCSLGCF